MKKRGLAQADKATRKRVAAMGGKVSKGGGRPKKDTELGDFLLYQPLKEDEIGQLMDLKPDSKRKIKFWRWGRK